MVENISSLILSIGKYIKAQHHPQAPSSSEEGENLKNSRVVPCHY